MKNAAIESVKEILRDGIEKILDILNTEINHRDNLNLKYLI